MLIYRTSYMGPLSTVKMEKNTTSLKSKNQNINVPNFRGSWSQGLSTNENELFHFSKRQRNPLMFSLLRDQNFERTEKKRERGKI